MDGVETDLGKDVDAEKAKDEKENDTVKKDTQLLYVDMLLGKKKF